ncbi:IclR family transcriptional regulator [Arthrobacter sp. 9AX]|uniref:IclR family transcriptional regulator n=1 Tax=Arthrobacter sp. 9AX TaxID=2653131 RepID=UPI0012EFDDB3|nr:IclR family transcriptional regulator [Arthrobacter sp. 9AX]VXB91421.1 IclR family transcriptional regulator [Arthrobacter sp. 9AX]
MDVQAAADGGEAAGDETADLTNKSVIKATVLLSELGRHRAGITVTELAQAVGMTRPTAFRLLLSLEQTGFVDRVDNRYTLGWEMARLGRLADPHTGAVARVQPILDDYAARLNETVNLAMVRDALTYDVIAEASGSRHLNVTMYVGETYPIHASATGKLMLAEMGDDEVAQALPKKLEAFTPKTITRRDELIQELHKIRHQGYSVLDNELEEGLFVVAFPVRDVAGALVGTVSVNGPEQRLKSDSLPATIDQLRLAGKDIAKALLGIGSADS